MGQDTSSGCPIDHHMPPFAFPFAPCNHIPSRTSAHTMATAVSCTHFTVAHCSVARPARRSQAAFAPAAPAQRMASVSSISAAGSLAPAAPARGAAARCRAATAQSVRSEISCECCCRPEALCIRGLHVLHREQERAGGALQPLHTDIFGCDCSSTLLPRTAWTTPADIMIKPDGVQRGLVGEIISRFERKGFKLVALKLYQCTK